MILVLGSNEDEHAKYVYDKLIQKNEEVMYFDSRLFPHEIRFDWSASSSPVDGSFYVGEKKIDFSDIKSVYWRTYYGIKTKQYDQSDEARYVALMHDREINSAIDSVFNAIDCLWVNSLTAYNLHKTKPYQTNLMAKNGIRVPDTLITNDANKMRDFYLKNNKNIIYKPVRGGALTKKITESDFNDDKLASLRYSPVQFQECIEGVDIRVYGFKNTFYAAEIQANTLDFRGDDNAKIVPVELPDSVIADCKKVMEILGLNFTGIDIRKTIEGEYVFIEANPSPMFIHFENMSNYPIGDTLVDLLINKNT